MKIKDKSSISVHASSYDFDDESVYNPLMETTLSGFSLYRIGRYDAFKAVRAWHEEIEAPSDEEMIRQMKFWYLSGSCNFEVEDAVCEYRSDFPLSELYAERAADDWVKVLKDDHYERLSEGTEGYADLILERHTDPYFIAERGEGKSPGVFDGYHRIGAAIAVGSKTCAVVYASRRPELDLEAEASSFRM